MFELRRLPIPGGEPRQESFGNPPVLFDWRTIQVGGKLLWACNPGEDARDVAEEWVATEGLGKKWEASLVEVDAPSDVAIPQSRRVPLETLQSAYDAIDKLGEDAKRKILSGFLPTREPEWAKAVPAAVKEYLKTSLWPAAWKFGDDGQPHVEIRIVETFVEVARASAGKDDPADDKSAPAPSVEDGPKPEPEAQPKDAPQTAQADLSALLASYGNKMQVPKAVAVVKDMLAKLNGADPNIDRVNYQLTKSELPKVGVKTFPALLQAAKE
jgi:hypothetical protein